jgi:hypothetical protein
MTRTFRITNCALGILGLTLLLACGGNGGGGGTKTAAGLTYTNPTTGDYKLVQDATNSTASHLILNLVGPDIATELSGVGFYLNTDATKVKWAVLSGGKRVSSSLFTNPLVESKVTTEGLQAGIYQKGNQDTVTTTATDVLATVALDLQPGVSAGTVITLEAPAGKAVILNKPGSTTATTPISITVGALVTN